MEISFLGGNYSVHVTVAALLLSIAWMLTRRNSSENRLPPGPPGWPLIGNLPALFRRHHASSDDDFMYSELARKYGDIFKLQFGSQLTYVLSNVEHVRKIFSHSKVAGRPSSVAKEIVFGQGTQGIAFASGPAFTTVVRFTKNLFRDLGIGKGVFESTIRSQIDRLSGKLDQLTEAKVPCSNLADLINSTIGSMICCMLYGQLHDYEDDELKTVLNLLSSWLESSVGRMIVQTNQLICRLPFGPGKKVVGCLEQFKTFFKRKILESKLTAIPEYTPKDFISAYVVEMERGERYFNESNLIVSCVELLTAGIMTTTHTLQFAILYLTTHPGVQVKCQEELDLFVKDHGMPSYSDRSKLPYLQAIIQETGRLASASPIGIPHLVEEDLEMFGYAFPKGTMVVANFVNLNMNRKKFPETHDFRPERFMEAGEFRPDKDLIPFSVGRRACTGEPLARMNIFLFLATLLHKYTFTPPPGYEMPDYRFAPTGSGRIPPAYKVVISKRGAENSQLAINHGTKNNRVDNLNSNIH